MGMEEKEEEEEGLGVPMEWHKKTDVLKEVEELVKRCWGS